MAVSADGRYAVNRRAVDGRSVEVLSAELRAAAGLIVAIPSLMFYRYFRGRVDDYLHTLEQSSEQLLTQLVRVMAGNRPSGLSK